jgi:hypothetical protein
MVHTGMIYSGSALPLWCCNILSETSACGDRADATACRFFSHRETRAGECWAVGEVLSEKTRKTLMPVYVGLAAVRAASDTALACHAYMP